MNTKVREKKLSIELRKKGFTYGEILEKVPVAKSSLSLWLKDLPLTGPEKKYLKKRTNSNITRGRIKAATTLRNNRIKRENKFLEEAKCEFNKFKSNHLFLIGVALYWAEGTKRSNICAFMNSDVDMIKVFIHWASLLGLGVKDMSFDLYIHKHYANEHCENFWAKNLGIKVESINIYFKPDNKQIKKRPNYKGCLRVRLRSSKKLLYKLKIWQNMLASKFLRP